MLKHTFIIATLLLTTAAACQKDKATDASPAPAHDTPKTTAIPTGAANNTLPSAANNAPANPANAGAATGDNPSPQPGDAAPQTEHEVQAASLAVSRARGDFLAVADVRLNELDKKLATMKKDKTVKKDWVEIDRLRADTEQVRTGIRSNAKLYTLETQRKFEDLVSKIDELLR